MSNIDQDRRHFAAVAEAKTAERRERIREAIATPAVARMNEGLELGYAAPSTPEREARLDEKALGQAELQSRARRLGLR